MPGYGHFSGFAAAACGGPRGCFHRSNTSMTIMRPPQHGHSGRKSSGCADGSSTAGRRDREQLAGPIEICLAGSASEPAVVTDAMEAARQDREQEATDELVGGERHDLPPVGAKATIILVAEGDAALALRAHACGDHWRGSRCLSTTI
jgi:hypothetical protein